MKKIFKLLSIVFITLSFVGCSFGQSQGLQDKGTEQENTEINKRDKDVKDIQEIVETLCSEDFGGRLCGSEGNKKAEEYIINKLENIGVQPLYDQYSQTYNHEMMDETFNPIQKEVHNVIGVIKGNDSTKAIVISAHFDHIGDKDGVLVPGALDNASGVASLIKTAEILKEESNNEEFDRDIIIAFFNGEEWMLQGSDAFVNKIKDKYSNIYDINIDCVGGKEAGKITLNNESKISNKLIEEMKNIFKEENIEFSEEPIKNGISDHASFEDAGLANICFEQEDLKSYIHKPEDTPDKLDYDKILETSELINHFIKANADKDF